MTFPFFYGRPEQGVVSSQVRIRVAPRKPAVHSFPTTLFSGNSQPGTQIFFAAINSVSPGSISGVGDLVKNTRPLYPVRY